MSAFSSSFPRFPLLFPFSPVFPRFLSFSSFPRIYSFSFRCFRALRLFCSRCMFIYPRVRGETGKQGKREKRKNWARAIFSHLQTTVEMARNGNKSGFSNARMRRRRFSFRNSFSSFCLPCLRVLDFESPYLAIINESKTAEHVRI